MRLAPGIAGCASPTTTAHASNVIKCARDSMATTSATPAAARAPLAMSRGRTGPMRSMIRPCTTEPHETPMSMPADTSPATPNEPVTFWT